MTNKKRKMIEEINNSRFIGLEEILMLLDCKKPFKKNGELSVSGEDARRTLVTIVNGLECIGAIQINRNFEDYLDEIINNNF